MLELEDRLRRLADEHARAARVPAASAAVRRGRRRRRRLTGAATTLTVLLLLAGLVGVRELREPAAPPTGPAAPVTTAACPGRACIRPRPTVDQGGFEPVKGTVVAQGKQPGYRWRLVIRRHKLPGGQYELVMLLQREGYQPGDLVTLEPVRLSMTVPTKRDPAMTGIVTDRTALVRLLVARNGAAASPIEVRPTDGGGVFPHNAWFVAFLPEDTELYGIELLDRQGGTICAERIRQVPLPGGAETMPDGSCF
jgi:hypothetical protein